MATEYYADNCRKSLGAAIVEITEERVPALIERAYDERVDACDFCWWALQQVRAAKAQPAPAPVPTPAPAVSGGPVRVQCRNPLASDAPAVSNADILALRRDAAAACAAFVAAVAGRTATVSVPVIAEHLDTLIPDVLRLFLRRREEAAAVAAAQAIEAALGCYTAVDLRGDEITIDVTHDGASCTLARGQISAWDAWEDGNTDGDPDSLDERAADLSAAAHDARAIVTALDSRRVAPLLLAWREVCQ